MKTSILVLALALTSFSFSAEARRDQRREGRQQARIAQGVKSGELTNREAQRLHHGQKRLDRAQRHAMQDGVVTPEEKTRLEKMQDRQSKRIYTQKHDGQKREERTAEAGE